MNRLHVVLARALRLALDPRNEAGAAARELAQIAGHERWLLEQARARVSRRLVERPSAVGERALRLLTGALVIAEARAGGAGRRTSSTRPNGVLLEAEAGNAANLRLVEP